MLKSQCFFFFIFLVFFACQKPSDQKKKNLLDKAQETSEELVVPEIHLQKNQFMALETDRFKHAMGGKEIDERTSVKLKYDVTYLEIHFKCLDNPRVDQNDLIQDDRGLFKQEVFELFIAAGKEAPENYLEIQINPNQALFLGRVTNRFKSNRDYHFDSIKAQASGIERMVKKNAEDQSWSGYLKIPWSLINTELPNQTVFRLNMFRIISNEDHFEKDWAGKRKNMTYACWSSTMSKKRPNFHHPQYFGYLYLK